jgi:hypothetical protein
MTPIEPLQVSEVVERLEAPVSRVRERAGCQNCDDDLKEKAAEIIRTLQSENEALRAGGEEARRALAAVLPFLPIEVRYNPDYGEITFGEHQSQAMTMAPDDWLALNDASKAHRGLEEVLGSAVDKSASEGTSSLLTRDAPTSGKGEA